MTLTNPAAPFTVLLVEDELVQRMDAAEALRAGGLAVVEVPGIDLAVEALDRVADLRAMVIDVELEGEAMDGFALARVAAARWPEIAILVVSGKRDPQEDQLPAGARFLRKPYDAHEMTSTIFSLVERRAEGIDGLSDEVP